MAAPKRKKHAGGRPRAFDDKKRKRAIQLTGKGLSLNGIAKILRVDRSTLDAEIKRNDQFREDMLAADGGGELWCLERWRKCMEGKGTTSQLNAIVKYMARKWPDDYALSKKLESEDKSVTVNIQNNVRTVRAIVAEMSDEQLKALQEVKRIAASGNSND